MTENQRLLPLKISNEPKTNPEKVTSSGGYFEVII
jgi:hypothetical protein